MNHVHYFNTNYRIVVTFNRNTIKMQDTYLQVRLIGAKLIIDGATKLFETLYMNEAYWISKNRG